MIVRSGPGTRSAWASIAVPALLAAHGGAASESTAASSPWIAAGAGILGAAIGGTVTGAVSLRAEDKRQAHTRELANEERKHRRADAERIARGIGLLLRDDLRAALAKGRTTLEKPTSISAVSFAPRLAADDRKILARYLRPAEYDAVADAEIHAEQITGYLVARPGKALDEPGRVLLEIAVQKIELGETTLTTAVERFDGGPDAGGAEERDAGTA